MTALRSSSPATDRFRTHADERTAPRWPLWFGPAGFLVAMGASVLLASIATGVQVALGISETDDAGVNVIATFVQDLVLVGVAVVLASRLGRPVPADFGLRSSPARHAIGWLVTALVGYYGLTLLYTALVRPEGEQSLLETLGADRNSALLVSTAVIVVVLAPVCEEVFFRGFFHRSLRNRLSRGPAVAISACVFGAIHFTGPDTLVLLPLLALLGAIFCMLYELTGSLYPSIALHVINNSIALATTATSDAAPTIAALVGSGMLAILAVASLRGRRRLSM